MSTYKLIAFDMDGTLLNSRKEIPEKTITMMKKAVQAGKQIALSTGRGLAELTDYLAQISEIRYLDCTSGAIVYDWKDKKIIYNHPIPTEKIKQIMEIAKYEDTMLHMLNEHSIVQKNFVEKMEEYHMGVYQPMFEKVTIKYENIYEAYGKNPFPVGKCNIYHRTPESRERTFKRIQKAGIPVAMVRSEITSLEISEKGVNKGTGILKLCDHLGITSDEVIAVGDAENDKEVLKIAGLAVAMGNAGDSIKDMADVVVSDCDHDGCAEAIEKYLLK